MNTQINDFDVRKKDFYKNIVGAYRFSDLYDHQNGQRQNMLADITRQGLSNFDDYLNDLYWRKKIDKTFEYTKIVIANKEFLKSEKFKSWDDDKKSIALCNMIGQWSEIFTKDEYMDLVKDWSPNLKSIALVSFFQDNESIYGDLKQRAQAASFTINDLDSLEINKWPEKTRYDFISWPLKNPDCSAFSDLQTVEDLENSQTFKEASQDIKLLLIAKLLDNRNKNLDRNSRDVKLINELAKNNLTPGYLNRLAGHIYKKYGLVNDFDNEIIQAFNRNYMTGGVMRFSYLQKLDGYNELDANSKLRFLIQCDRRTIKNLDKLLPELDLKDYWTRESTLRIFFRKSGITADVIAQKNNWPVDVKTVAFKSLPKFQRTAKNFKIIFWPEEIKLLLDNPKSSSVGLLNRIKFRVKEYINILKPDFNLSNKNKKQMNDLIKRVDEAKDPKDIRKLFDQMTIYKTMSELNADQIAEYLNRIKDLIGNDERKAKDFRNYLFANGNLPDFISKDPDLAGFVHYVKNAFDKSGGDFEFWSYLGIYSEVGLYALVIPVVILAPELLFSLPVIPFISVILSPGIIAFALFGIGLYVSNSRLKKNLAATKTEEFTDQLKNLKKEVDKAVEKDPKLKQQVKNITDKVKQQENRINNLSEQEIALYNLIDQNYKDDAAERKQNIKEILDLSTGNREDLAFELTTEIMLDVSMRDLTEREVYNFIDENYKDDAAERKQNIKMILDNTMENREITAGKIFEQLIDDKELQEKQAEQKEENVVESQNNEKDREEDLNHDADTESSVFDIAGHNLFDEVQEQEKQAEQKEENVVESQNNEKDKEEDLNHDADTESSVFDIAGHNLFDEVQEQEKQAEQKNEVHNSLNNKKIVEDNKQNKGEKKINLIKIKEGLTEVKGKEKKNKSIDEARKSILDKVKEFERKWKQKKQQNNERSD